MVDGAYSLKSKEKDICSLYPLKSVQICLVLLSPINTVPNLTLSSCGIPIYAIKTLSDNFS